MASTRSSLITLSASFVLPASIGPPDTNTAGMFSRSAAINMPGVILSQLEMHTIASAQCALTMYSTESAIRSREGSEYSIPPWPIAMPSSTAMVLNSLATAPAFSICSATSRPMSRRCTCPGTNCVNELTTAMIGLPKSVSFMPVARQSARAPAMLRPWVLVAERNLGMISPKISPPFYMQPPRKRPPCPSFITGTNAHHRPAAGRFHPLGHVTFRIPITPTPTASRYRPKPSPASR